MRESWTATRATACDHNFVLSGAASEEGLRPVATLWSEKSGRLMKVWTTEPGVQFYAPGNLPRRDPTPQRRRQGLAVSGHPVR